jgi:hypothetical protein
MQWTDKLVTRLKKERKASLKKEGEKSHKIILNASIVTSRGIILEITTQNRNRMKKSELKLKSQTRNESLSRKNIPKENKTKSEEIPRRKLFSR